MPSRLRVVSGYVVGLLVFALARPTPRSLVVSLPFFLLGEAIRVWASAHIEKTQQLATGGPYAHTRNPLYLGSLFLAIGVVVACFSVPAAVAVGLYLVAFYPSVIKEEAAFLKSKFSREYEAWAWEVPAFWPRLTPAGPRQSRFSWERVARNREWSAALALPLVLLVLWARRLLPF